MLEFKLFMLISLANAVPVIVHKMLGSKWAYPLDGHLKFFDGRPLLGTSKTVRGVVSAVAVTTLVTPLLDLSWQVGAVISGLAMLGDLLSSFIKRRLGMPSSSMALGLDQVPESLLPLLGCTAFFALTWYAIAVLVAIFFVAELLISRVLYRFHLRDTPY